MDSNKKDKANLDKILAAGDAWLRKYGIMGDVQHNSIVLNLYAAFDPVVKDLEYYMDPEGEQQRIDLTVYIDIYELVLRGKGKYLKSIIKWLPDVRKYLNEENKNRVDELIDILPDADIPLIRNAKTDLITEIHELLNQYLHGYEINVRLKRFKETK